MVTLIFFSMGHSIVVGGGVDDDGSVASGTCGHSEVVRIWFLTMLGVVLVTVTTKCDQICVYRD